MLDISLETHEVLYKDYNAALDYLLFLKDDDFEYPKNVTNFHVYSEIKTEKELLCVKSFLATQNLSKCKLVLWSDYDVSSNPLLAPYVDYIDLRVYSDSVADGTDLAGSEWLTAHDTKYYMRSGIVRFLVTHKFGGIWADMDMVFLRSFKPILDQEWAYMWGAELDFANHGPCAAMMSFQKESPLSQLCINEILSTQIVPDSTVLDHILLAKVYRKFPFTVFPSAFFNTEWQMNTYYNTEGRVYDPNGLGTATESGWFKKNQYSPSLFPEAFSWHWHNSSYKNHKVEEGSKFNLIERMIDGRLKNKGIL